MEIEKLIERISNMHITFRGWIAAFFGIMFARYFLENFSSISITGYWSLDATAMIHGSFYYLAATISLLLFVGLFVDRAKLERLALFALFGNIVAPLLDLLASGRGWSPMHYISADGGGLARDFLMPFSVSGITTGMKTEFLLGACLLLWYVLYATKSVIRAMFAVLGSYVILFFWGALPSIWKLLHDFFSSGNGALSVSQFFITSEASSVIVRNFLHPTIQLSYFRGAEVFFDVAISQLYYILIFVLVAAYFFVRHRAKFFAVLKNTRQFRAAHYYLMVGLGILAGLRMLSAWIAWNWIDITSLIVLLLAYFCARAYAGGVNDIEDLEIDKVSNPGRALPLRLLTVDDIRSTNLFFLLWALLGGFLAGHYMFFTIIVALFASHIYSVPPLRLKNYPFIATFLIALSSLAAFAAGFYFAVPDKTTKALPVAYIVLILLGLTLGENVKDVKDVAGDKKAGAYTLPVIFGEKIGKRIVGVLVAIAFLLVPLMLRASALFVPSLLAGVGAYILVNRKKYSERPIFLVGSVYAAFAIWMMFF